MIDLHSHTDSSDGQHPPEELVRLAHLAGVRCLAVTDHDTVAGVARARAAGEVLGVEIVAGIELSAELNRREVHILGHFVRPDDPQLMKLSEGLRHERRRRMEQMVAKLVALGIPMTLAEVERQAGSDNLGRPHLAQALLERGLVSTVKEAFDRYLGDGRPACVGRERLPTAEAIALIKRSGGVATLAHPGLSKVTEHEIQQLAREGLQGLEVFHTDHNPSTRQKYQSIAEQLGLVPTAGSDFHGERVAPRRMLGSANMSRDAFERLRGAAT
jgi:predicted metal-dependent phosphoesterase TrpH